MNDNEDELTTFCDSAVILLSILIIKTMKNDNNFSLVVVLFFVGISCRRMSPTCAYARRR